MKQKTQSQFIIKNVLELEEVLKKNLLPFIETGKQYSFSGELGAGKTTIISKLVYLLGSNDQVSSPSYGLMNEYQASLARIELKIEHWDLYRLNKLPEELMSPVEPDQIRFIEWAEKFELECDYTIKIIVPFECAESREVSIYS